VLDFTVFYGISNTVFCCILIIFGGVFEMRKGEVKTSRISAIKPLKNKIFKQLSEEYIRQAEIKNMAKATIKSYRYIAWYFANFIGKGFLCKDITLQLVEDYLIYGKL
jgi:hypothetical protein